MLQDKVRKLENELTGQSKGQIETITQTLDMTKRLNAAERERDELRSRVAALQEYNDHNSEIIEQKVRIQCGAGRA